MSNFENSGPDAPYPGMIAAFETHYGQSFRDKEWRTEAACWAAAWSKATARAAVARAEAALSSSDDTPPSAEERRLRRMLCLRCHGTAAYMDDGEASFGGDEFQRPTDYLRESLDSIQQAWVDAVMKEAASVLGDGKPFMRGCELRDDALDAASNTA